MHSSCCLVSRALQRIAVGPHCWNNTVLLIMMAFHQEVRLLPHSQTFSQLFEAGHASRTGQAHGKKPAQYWKKNEQQTRSGQCGKMDLRAPGCFSATSVQQAYVSYFNLIEETLLSMCVTSEELRLKISEII